MARARGRLRLVVTPGTAVLVQWETDTDRDGGSVGVSGGTPELRRIVESILFDEPASVYVPRHGGSAGAILPNVWEWTRSRANAAVLRDSTPFRRFEILEEPDLGLEADAPADSIPEDDGIEH